MTIGRRSTLLGSFAIGVARLVATGCHDATQPTFGSLQVGVWTTGGDLDSSYTVLVDGVTWRYISKDTTVLTIWLATGRHTVALNGVAANCTVADANPRLVGVSASQVTLVQFAVSCLATGVKVSV